ncbi:MAG: hypothetical protein ABI682_02530 [Acidobacteriota bacterium]
MAGGVLRERQPAEGFGQPLGEIQVPEASTPEFFDGLGVPPRLVRLFARSHPFFEIAGALLRLRRQGERRSDERDVKCVSESHKNHESRRTTIRLTGCKIHAPLVSSERPRDPRRRRCLTAILRR